MKKYLLVLLISLLISSCKQSKNALPVLNSNVEKITYLINGKPNKNWRINPKLNPDRLRVECKDEKISKVTFASDIDTISFNIKKGEKVQFNVLYKKDTALTEIVGIPKNVNFSEEFIKNHTGKSFVKIPEVHELANIMVAISKVGQIDSNMVDMKTPYHKEVIKHFLKYKDHPAIDTINKHITDSEVNSYWYYYALKMNACGYLFNNKGEIIDDGIITKMGFNNPEDPFIQNKKLFEDFSKKSNFRKFYKEHQEYYNELISTYNEFNPIQKMKNWLEKKFKITYGSYLALFSPLVSGAHAANRYEDNGFKLSAMFIRGVNLSENHNKNLNEMINSRVVFTEIDHNFVNPVSDRFIKEIQNAFSNRSKWVNDNKYNSGYRGAYSVFNEYMTWAFFSLYCLDNFPKNDVDEYMITMERFMMGKTRGFIHFKEFNQELIRLYKNNPKITVDEIYTEMIKWSNNVNSEL